MADRVERVREVPADAVAKPSGTTLAQRIVWYVAGVILILLAFRFVLRLLGANPNSGFADFIYDVSHPFVAPFFGLFSYDLDLGVSNFEIYTLVAMAVYAVAAWLISKLFALNDPEPRA